MNGEKERVPNEELENSLPALRKQVAGAIRSIVSDLNGSIETARELGVDVDISTFHIHVECRKSYPQINVQILVREVL